MNPFITSHCFRPWTLVLWAMLSLLALTPSLWAEENKQVIAGAGPSAEVVDLFTRLLSKGAEGSKYTYVVPAESIKHDGGLKAAGIHLFGRSGRPLNSAEKEQEFDEIWLARISIAFVVGPKSGVKSLTLEQVCAIFNGKVANWKEVGGADHEITLFTREPTEALFQTLKKEVPCMNEVAPTKYVFKKDNQLAGAIGQSGLGDYAIGFGSKEKFPPTVLLQVKDFSSGVNVGLIYHKRHAEHPLVKEAGALARSEPWRTVLRENNMDEPK